MKTLKKIVSIVFDVLVALIFVVSLFVLIASISSSKTGVPSVFGYTFSTVETDSMSGFFEIDDVVIGKKVKDVNTLKEQDVISFFQKVNGKTIINTHRIVGIQEIGGIKYFTTKGDHETEVDSAVKSEGDIISLYQGKITGFGKVVDFFKSSLGFVLCVILPFAIIIIFEIFKLVRTYIIYSTNKDEPQEVAPATQTPAELSDEAKNAIIAEYLAKQAQEQKEENIEENT